jgi:hypothetical protein
MKLNKLSLKDNFTETLLETDDFIFSIAFCKETNGIFYSNFSKNNISMFFLDKKNITLYKEDNITSPKSICLSKNHDRIFFEDNKNGVSGFYIKSSLVFSWTNNYSNLKLESQQNSRNTMPMDFMNIRTKSNCIQYIDGFNIVFVSRYKNNLINYIDNSGRMCNFIGNGRPDFCSSSNLSNISFNCPTGLCFVNIINELFVADTNNHIIRSFSKNKEWKESKIIGIPTKEGEQNGDYNKSTFRFPSEICNFDENIFVIDEGKKIRKIDINKNEVKTVYSTSNFIKSITCDKENVYWTEV